VLVIEVELKEIENR